MNDDFLTKFRKEPRPEFAAALYQRINKTMQAQSKPKALRFATLTLSLLAVLTATILLLPSARAFAQGFMQQVGGYIFVLGGQPIEVRRAPDQLMIWKTLDAVSIETRGDVPIAKDPAEAGGLVGFTVLTPTYLPDGYTAMSGWFVVSEDNGKVVTNGYRDADNHFFIINQWKVGEDASRTYAKDQIVNVTVHGQPGVWLPAPSASGKNALVWDENGITYSLITDSVSLDELLKVAESLSQ